MENKGVEEFSEEDPEPSYVAERQKLDTTALIIDFNVLDELDAFEAKHEYVDYLNSIEDELPNHGQADTDPQAAYATNRDLRAELRSRVSKAQQQALLEFSKEYPVESSQLKLIANATVVTANKNRINYKATYLAIMDCLLDRGQTLKTQKDILERVKFITGIHELTANLWTRTFRSYTFTLLNKRISDEGLKISLVNCKTLSDVRKRVQAYFTSLNGELKLKAELVIAGSKLVVNGTTYPITLSGSGTSEYKRIRVNVGDKRQWIRLDALEALLDTKNK
ncbi:MAG: hypothetical protein Q8J66_04050 [Methylotenera sp.]|nr:hypothetical protein [Methylotenera sp.]